MAAPGTPILDTFNGADQNPLVNASGGGTWAAIGGGGGFGLTSLQRLTNQCAGNGGGGSVMAYSPTFRPNCEVFGTLGATGAAGNYWEIALRGGNTGDITTFFSYVLRWTQGSGIRIIRFAGLAATTIGGPYAQELAAGDNMWLRARGTLLEAFYKPAAGNYSSLGTATDANFANGGAHVMTITGTGIRVDDFGGGNIDRVLSPAQLDGLGYQYRALQ